MIGDSELKGILNGKIKLIFGLVIILALVMLNMIVAFGSEGNGYLATNGENIYKIIESNPRSGNSIYEYDMKGKNGSNIYYCDGYVEIKGVYNNYLYFNEYSKDTGLKVMNLNDYSVKKIYETVGSVKYFGGYKIYMTLRTEYFDKLLCANINGENVKPISDCLKQYIVKSDKLYYIESIDNQTNCFRVYRADVDGSNAEILYDRFYAVFIYFFNNGLRWDLLEQGKYNKYLSFEQKWTFYLRNLDTGEDKALDVKELRKYNKENIGLFNRISCSDKEKEYYFSDGKIYKLNSQNEAVKIGKIRNYNFNILSIEDKYLYYADDENNLKKIRLNVNKNDNKNIFVKIFDLLFTGND